MNLSSINSTPAGSLVGLPRPPPVNCDTCALFLDIDGTLLDLASHPDAVTVEPKLPAILRALHSRLRGAIALVSGRALARIDTLLRLPEFTLVGSHGAEIRLEDGKAPCKVPPARGIGSLASIASEQLAHLPGVVIEEKPDAIALHWRARPDARESVLAVAQHIAQSAGSAYTLLSGDAVVELRRHGTNKGTAVTFLMGQLPYADRQPWVIGDDLTDEHAFKAADRLGGFGVIVGNRRPTTAAYALPDPHSVRNWLLAILSQESR